jgi:hypothetical protein
MKSNKQRRKEIKQRRLQRAEKLAAIDRLAVPVHLLSGMVAADHSALVHNNTYGLLPSFYVDKPFVCRDCGSHEVWTAKQQKWWYEIAKGNIDSTAVRCRPCRKKSQAQKTEARTTHLEGIARKQAKQ